MHELDIAKKISHAVVTEAKKAGFIKISELKVKAGRTQAIDPKQLSYFMKDSSKIFDNCTIDVEVVDVILECEKCKHHFSDERFNDEHFAHEYSHAPFLYVSPECPKCGFDNSKLIKGNELEIVSLHGE